MCEHLWDERLLKEQADRLKRPTSPAMPTAKPQEPERKPERKPQDQPDPVPV